MKTARQETASRTLDGQTLPWNCICRIVLLVTGLLAYFRLFIGVDVTDESFYNSIPYAFCLGCRPYSDELIIMQNVGILLTPLFKIHHWLLGSSLGLVLFNRHIYFILLGACSYLTFRATRGYLGENFGRLLAAFAFTFSYFNIPSLSYNTLGAMSLWGGMFQLLNCRDAGRRVPTHWHIFGANCCFIVSAFAYPTLLFSSMVGFAVSLWLSFGSASKDASWRVKHDRIAWGASCVLGVVGALCFLASFGLERIGDSLAYTRSFGYDLVGGAPQKTVIILGQFPPLFMYFPGVAALVLLPILPARSFHDSRSAFVGAILASSVVFLWLLHRQPSLAAYPTKSVPLVLGFGLLFPLLLCFLPDRHQARNLSVVIGLPSLVAAVAVAFSSDNGLPSTTLVFFPPAVCTLLVVGLIARSIDRNPQSNGMRKASFMGVLLPIVVFQTYSLLERSYRDDPFAMDARPTFASGPFAGLITTEINARRLSTLTADLNSLGDSVQTIFIYDRFPAGYLLSELKPRTFSTWIFWPVDSELRTKLLQRLFAAEEPPPDAILQIGPRPAWVDPEIKRLNYQVKLERPEFNYVLLVRKNS